MVLTKEFTCASWTKTSNKQSQKKKKKKEPKKVSMGLLHHRLSFVLFLFSLLVVDIIVVGC